MKNSLQEILFLFILVITVSFSSQAQCPDPLIQNIHSRKTTNLDGFWSIIVDPLENGYYSYRYQPRSDGFFKDAKMQSSSDLIEYNFDEGKQLSVPGDWNTQKEKLYYYEGTVWYKRSFDYDIKAGNRVFVYFGAINYDAKVYLNGQKVGDHIGGYTSFNFEVTDLLKEKDNLLVVKVDNTRKREAIPTVNIDWWNYGGITRSVYLVETPTRFVQDYFIQLRQGSLSEVEGWVQLSDGASEKVVVSIPELKITKTFKTDTNGLARVALKGKFKFWSPENPKLYEVTISSATDEVSDQIGFRTIRTDGYKILLNGNQVFLRGITVHEEAPFGAGRVTTQEECEVLVGWAKELGCNFIRLAHYPHSEEMVKTAERNGLMIWSEVPVYWTVLFDNEDTYANAENQLREMVTRDKNRVGIILWSVANETPVGDARVSFLSRLAGVAKSLDNTRLTTAALEISKNDEEGNRLINDPLGAYIDVIGINQYCGWYSGTPAECGQVRWKTEYNKPMIMSEYGGGALQGYHGDPDQRWTEEYQDEVYKNNIEMIKNIEFLAGATPWILKDFMSPRRNLDRIQNDFNRKGLISDRGIKKKAFYRLQEFYNSEK